MRKYLAVIIGLLLSSLIGYAKTYTIDNLPVATQGEKEIYVCNPDGILSPSTDSLLCERIAALDDSTGVQILVVAVDSINSSSPDEWGVELGNRIGVGTKKTHSGVIILLVKSQRSISILPGDGVERFLPDITCDRIIADQMVPSFKDGQWNQGMVNGVFTVCSQLENIRGEFDSEGSGDTDLLIFFAVLFGIIGVSIYLIRRANRCPDCGKQLKEVGRHSWKEGADKEVVRTTCQCPYCKRIVYKTNTYYTSSHSGGFGGGFGGGGFSGGGPSRSFGGGGFGGGGASRRF